MSALLELKKFQIYNKNKEITGMPRDMQKQLPDCDINIDIVTVHLEN